MPSSAARPYRVLVVTPTWGESAWLPSTMASIRQMPLAQAPILVAPESKRADLASQYPEAKVVADPGGGMYAAINAGAAAGGEWDAFTYLNDDDLLLPHFASAIAIAAAAGDRPLIIYGGVRLIDSAGRRLGAIPVSPSPELNRDLYRCRIEPVYQHGTLITRAAWTQLGGCDETFRFCGDSELLARACVQRIPFRRVGGAPLAAFRLRAGQLTKNREAMIAERRRVDEKLRLLDRRGGWAVQRARALFRFANASAYAERVVRFGFVSFDRVLERGR